MFDEFYVRFSIDVVSCIYNFDLRRNTIKVRFNRNNVVLKSQQTSIDLVVVEVPGFLIKTLCQKAAKLESKCI